MPEAWVHIGAPKCGSSLIQGLLNEPDARAILRPHYLDVLCRDIQASVPLLEPDNPDHVRILDNIRVQFPREDISFSVENVFGLRTHSDNRFEQSAWVIRHLFQGYDVKLFMYVRRQDTFLESMYNQDVKRQEQRGFPEYMEAVRFDNLHWDAICEVYSEFDLTVRPFEKRVLHPRYEDFVDALFQWFGERVVVENLPVINPSLSLEGLEVQLTANHVLTEQQAYDLSTWLERHCPKKPEDRHRLMDAAMQNDILARFRESNERLFARFMPDFDPSYYLGNANG